MSGKKIPAPPGPAGFSLTLGTRGSPLALAQAHQVARRLAALGRESGTPIRTRIRTLQTTGDREVSGPLRDIGGKGLFTKEIDAAQLAGEVEVGVHSMKDLATRLPDGLVIAAVLPREDPRDALFARGITRLADLPPGAVLGTASLRRAAQVRALRPDLRVVSLRGNVQTRLRKLAAREIDATLLALAGLNRLELAGEADAVLETDEMLPAVAQGAIALTCRADDPVVIRILAALDDPDSADPVTAERAMLAVLDGSCRTPIAGLARLRGADIHLEGLVALPDGSEVHRAEATGPRHEAQSLGRRLGELLRDRAGPGFMARLLAAESVDGPGESGGSGT